MVEVGEVQKIDSSQIAGGRFEVTRWRLKDSTVAFQRAGLSLPQGGVSEAYAAKNSSFERELYQDAKSQSETGRLYLLLDYKEGGPLDESLPSWSIHAVLRQSGTSLELVGDPSSSTKLALFLQSVRAQVPTLRSDMAVITEWLREKNQLEFEGRAAASDSVAALWEQASRPAPRIEPQPETDRDTASPAIRSKLLDQVVFIVLKGVPASSTVQIVTLRGTLFKVSGNVPLSQKTVAALAGEQWSVVYEDSDKDSKVSPQTLGSIPEEAWRVSPQAILLTVAATNKVSMVALRV